ncbi:hypothetical protein [Nostoc sp.]|uniref:hypothetical protein n=1 Tax=Nostoc sp. TaxID=1180 RepID=UPI002FF754CC
MTNFGHLLTQIASYQGERCLRWSLSFAVPLPYGTLRERGSKLRAASRREMRATPTLDAS